MGGPELIDFRSYNQLRQRIADLEKQLAEVTRERDLLNHALDAVREISIISLPDQLGYLYRRSVGDWCHPDSSINAVFPTALDAIRAAMKKGE